MAEKFSTKQSVRSESHGDPKKPLCPICGGKSAGILYGYVEPPPLSVAPGLVHVLNPVAFAKAAEHSVEEWEQDPLWQRVRTGEVVLGGCVVGPWKWKCHECGHRWPGEW